MGKATVSAATGDGSGTGRNALASGWHAPELAAACTLVDRFVEREMAANGTPGLALAITDRSRLLAVRNSGFADLAANVPVQEETLFETGSIGKTFTAVCLLQLAAEGAIDLDAPVTRYLPWFAIQSEHAPITIHHLLSHTAGIIYGGDYACDSRYQVWALRDSTVGGPPGERYYYSNVGYKALGFLLEAVTGKPYGTVVQKRIHDPLGMAAAANAITHEVRKRLAVGYAPFFDDRPHRPAHGVVPATWLETTTGDGSLASSAAALCAFLRMLLNRGDAPGGALLSEEGFAFLLGPHAEVAPGVGHGYGVETKEVAGQPAIGHDGDMVGYAAAMYGLPGPGLGAVALINGPGDANAACEFALRAVAAALAGDDLPDLPPDRSVVANAADYAGVFWSGAAVLEVVAEGDRLVLVVEGARVALEPRGDDAFLVDHPNFALFPLRFGRDDDGAVVEAMHGADWYPGERYAGAIAFAAPAAWAAYPGHYRTHTPWTPNFRVVLRKGALRVVWPAGDELPMVADGDAFRVDEDPWYPERIGFDTVVDGVALRAKWAGGEDFAYRFFTP